MNGKRVRLRIQLKKILFLAKSRNEVKVETILKLPTREKITFFHYSVFEIISQGNWYFSQIGSFPAKDISDKNPAKQQLMAIVTQLWDHIISVKYRKTTWEEVTSQNA